MFNSNRSNGVFSYSGNDENNGNSANLITNIYTLYVISVELTGTIKILIMEINISIFLNFLKI